MGHIYVCVYVYTCLTVCEEIDRFSSHSIFLEQVEEKFRIWDEAHDKVATGAILSTVPFVVQAALQVTDM